ncbi:MAG: phospholipase D-like domain-containing protein [bacterium]
MKTLAVLALLLAVPTHAEVVLTAPHCDVCTAEDKAWLQARSPTTQRIVALIDGARATLDAAQFTFSVRAIEEALLRAHTRGIKVRLALDAGQQGADTAGARLAAAGVPVRFVTGQTRGQGAGLQHAKYLLVDGRALAAGSGNWSSTGTTINDESLIIQEADDDPLIRAFACHFNRIWDQQPEKAGACGLPDRVAFSPSTAPITLITRAVQGAKTSIDVLMHHLLFDKLMKELVRARARGVRVRIVVNAADRDETRGAGWDHLRGAGVEITSHQRGNPDPLPAPATWLAIVDGRTLLHGSGNWSGSAFFNNYEFFVRHEDEGGSPPSASASSSSGPRPDGEAWTPASSARQAAAATRIFFGNLHAHFSAGQGDALG